MLLQLDLARFVIVYITQGVFLVIFLLIVASILKRGTDREHIIISGFYFFIALGFLINFIYAPLTDLALVSILNGITNFCVFFGLIFLTVYILSLLISESKFTVRKQNMIFLVYFILLCGMYLIPGGVEIGPQTSCKPVWNFTFFLYLIILVSSMAIVPTLVSSLRLYKKMTMEDLQKRWKYFIIGVIGVYFIMYGTMLSNTLNNPEFRMIWSLIALTTFVWAYLSYYGIGKRI